MIREQLMIARLAEAAKALNASCVITRQDSYWSGMMILAHAIVQHLLPRGCWMQGGADGWSFSLPSWRKTAQLEPTFEEAAAALAEAWIREQSRLAKSEERRSSPPESASPSDKLRLRENREKS